MKFAILASALLSASPFLASALALPEDVVALATRNSAPEINFGTSDPVFDAKPLEKRKGGGGRSGGSSGSSSSGSSSSGGSSGSSTSGGAAAGGAGRGTTSPASYGRTGGTYAGGASTSFASGSRSPRGINPYLLGGGAALGLGLGAGALAYGAYAYNLDRVTYLNQTANANQTSPVKCYCARYQPCSCDDNNDDGYVQSLIGNGSYAAMQQNHVTKINNGTLYIDGSLNNGTSGTANAASGKQGVFEQAVWVGLAAAVGAAAWTF